MFFILDILVYHDGNWLSRQVFKRCLKVMLKRLNINVKTERNVHYNQSIFERSTPRPEIGTLSGVPGFVVIAVMEMEVHIDKSDLNIKPVKEFLQD
jgi:hypothetical protein